MRRTRFATILFISIFAMIVMTGCDQADASPETGTDTGEAADAKEKDAYDEYIRSAIESVGGDNNAAGPTQIPVNDGSKNVSTDRTAPDDFYVSSMDDDDTSDPYPDDLFAKPTSDAEESTSPSPTEDPNATPTPTPTPYITPEEFDTDKCCIYINGESDSAYGTEVVTAINKVREELGYPKLVSNKGLATCADRRTREIAANFSHTRPNGKMFTSVAPEHFRAEMLIIDNQKAEDTVDILIKRDPISRNLIFTEKYQSVGASSFKCNGMRYTVVAFGL